MLQGPATFLLAIMGCGEGEAQCQQVQVAPVRYESRAACMAAQESQLARYSSEVAFPVVVAECRASGARAQPVVASDIRRPDPQGRAPVQTASR